MSFGGLREGKGGAPFFWAFFSPKKEREPETDPTGARPKKCKEICFCKYSSENGVLFKKVVGDVFYFGY